VRLSDAGQDWRAGAGDWWKGPGKEMEQKVVGRVKDSVMNVPVDLPRAPRGCLVNSLWIETCGIGCIPGSLFYPAPYSRFSSTTGPALTLYYSTVITVYNVTGYNETLVLP
jgi:hypothetical protein